MLHQRLKSLASGRKAFLAAIAGAALLSTASTSAFAQDSTMGTYANIGVSLLSADIDLSDLDVQGNSLDLGKESASVTMITGRIGYRLNQYFAIEGDAGFGLGNDDFQRTIPVDTGDLVGIIDVDADAELEVKSYVGAFARGILPVSDSFDLFVRGGYGTATGKATVTGTSALIPGFSATASETDKVSGFAYGAGGEYHISERSSLRLDYSGIGGDVQFGSLTYGFKF